MAIRAVRDGSVDVARRLEPFVWARASHLSDDVLRDLASLPNISHQEPTGEKFWDESADVWRAEHRVVVDYDCDRIRQLADGELGRRISDDEL